MTKDIPIIDIFAGPGGLGEGFSAYNDKKLRFRIALSIEKDPAAHKTLELRSFYRQFDSKSVPDDYYDYVCGEKVSRQELFKKYPDAAKKAQNEAWLAELGSKEFSDSLIDRRIKKALNGAEDWVLIGGPPCQAYSIVGRSRMTGLGIHPEKLKNLTKEKLKKLKDEKLEVFDQDHRHSLYRQYLRIITKHRPQIFIMENVKGILTSKHQGDLVFEKIRRDLTHPWGVRSHDGYDIYSLSTEILDPLLLKPQDFVIKAEAYGIPQARHRVILIGIRKGSSLSKPGILKARHDRISVRDVISDLPILRSRVSKGKDTYKKWKVAQNKLKPVAVRNKSFDNQFEDLIINYLETEIPDFSGSTYIEGRVKPSVLNQWYEDPKLPGILNHESRSHMESDLTRYLFASCFAEINKRSPNLKEYPRALLPNHENAKNRKAISAFSDRFRVQNWDNPSTTIVSHISKDGHYYIHPDPLQCRSLTVREAARLQTFPDNYFFEGNRTNQYTQVGNAVPPYLAYQIAKIVSALLKSEKVEVRKKVAAVG